MKRRFLTILIVLICTYPFVVFGQDPDTMDNTFFQNRLNSWNSNGSNWSERKVCFATKLSDYSCEIAGVSQVQGNNTSVEKWAIVGGATGLVLGVIAGGVTSSGEVRLDLIADALGGNNVSESVDNRQVPYIVGGALLGAGIGALLGIIKKNTAMQDEKLDFYCQPLLAYNDAKSAGLLLSFSIRFY